MSITVTRPGDTASVEARVAEAFACDTARHELTILHDHGGYRHLKMSAPDHWCFWIDVVCWPGHLSVHGAYGRAYTFRARTGDMFAFFRSSGDRINPAYWAQKVISAAPGRDGLTDYDPDLFAETVLGHTADAVGYGASASLTDAVVDEILHDPTIDTDDDAHAALAAFAHDGFTFDNTSEWVFTRWQRSYLWACHAIVAAIAAYDTHHTGTDTASASGVEPVTSPHRRADGRGSEPDLAFSAALSKEIAR